MSTSLKTSVQIFGAAGLVLLAGCGADTTVKDTANEPVEIMDEAAALMVEDETTLDADMMAENAAAAALMEEEAGLIVEDTASLEAEGATMLDVSYTSPAGPETIAIAMTVVDGTVTAITATPEATHEISTKRQASFAAAVSGAVVGKSLTEIADLEAIGGSSLTTGGFKAAVATL